MHDLAQMVTFWYTLRFRSVVNYPNFPINGSENTGEGQLGLIGEYLGSMARDSFSRAKSSGTASSINSPGNTL